MDCEYIFGSDNCGATETMYVSCMPAEVDLGLDDECSMNQMMRRDGSCETCLKPHVMSDDGFSCSFVGYRSYDEDSYMGRLNNYVQYGKGFYYWGESGNSYFGTWLGGMKHGNGIKMWASGSSYMGTWRDDMMDGYGTYVFRSGKIYVGEIVANYFEGQGSFTWPDGTIIEGQFSNDEANGYAVKTWADGSYYEGDWVDGFEEGYGTMTYSDGSQQAGWWSAGQFQG